jgi:site-specific DNA recombinase
MKKQVGLWIRISNEDQAQGDSPKHHEYRGRLFAEAKEWEIVEVYNFFHLR